MISDRPSIPPVDNTVILQRIKELEKDWIHIEATRNSKAFKVFRQKMYLVTTEYIGRRMTEAGSDLAQLWLDRTRFFIETNQQLTILNAHLEKVLALLIIPGVIESISKIEHNAKVLAILCLQGTTIASLADYGLPERTVEDILARWLSQPGRQDHRHTPEEVVHMLYGPGVWSIYRHDVDEVDELPAHLYRSNLQVLPGCLQCSPLPSPVSAILPDTLC